MYKWLKPLGVLAVIIIFFSSMARLFSRGETLIEYADSNPEIAYATPAKPAVPEKNSVLAASPENTASPGFPHDNTNGDADTGFPDTVSSPEPENTPVSPDMADPSPADTDTADTVH